MNMAKATARNTGDKNISNINAIILFIHIKSL